MKRYWKLLIISLLVVLGVSMHYIQSARALNDEGITFKLETLYGNEAELDSRILRASYYDTYINRWLTITKDGSSAFQGHRSILTPYEPLQFKRYLQDYRQFMRGKDYQTGNYVEDEERVIYIKSPVFQKRLLKGEPLTFKVDALTKNTEDRVTYNVTVPAESSYSWLTISDVYVANGEIKFFVVGSTENNTDLSLYTIDEQQQKIVKSEALAKITGDEISSVSIYSYTNELSFANNANFVYQMNEWHYSGDGERQTNSRNELYMYTLETGENKRLEIPDAANLHEVLPQETDVYALTTTRTGLAIHRYQLDLQQWNEPVALPLKLDKERMPYLQVLEDKLYVASTNMLSIYDVHTAKLLYEGTFVGENVGPHYELLVEQIY